MLTTEALLNAETDVGTLAAVVNGGPTDPDVINRVGLPIKPLAKAIAEIGGSVDTILAQRGYEPPVAYAGGLNIVRASQTVIYLGQVFAPMVAILPFVTGAFDPAQWYLVLARTFLDRASLKGVAAVNGQGAHLLDALASGPFRFDSGNLKALCDLDPLEGNYLKPVGQDGSTGAWVREWEGYISPFWYGALGDNITNDSDALLAALAYSDSIVSNPTGSALYRGSAAIFIPGNCALYLGATTFSRQVRFKIKGENSGMADDYSSGLRFDDGVTGFIGQRYNTSGDTAVDDPTHTGADGSMIEGLYLAAGYNVPAAESASHAIQMRARMHVIRCGFSGWAANAVHIAAADFVGSPMRGNANGWLVDTITAVRCRNSLWVEGDDANAGRSNKVVGLSNRQSNIVDLTLLGNKHEAPWSESCGVTQNSIPCWTSNGGHVHAVRWGQEAYCAANAPPAGATSDVGWWYVGEGAVLAVLGRIAWGAGLTWRTGGPYISTCINTPCKFGTPYAEGGTPPAQASGAVRFDEAQFGVGVAPIVGMPVVSGANQGGLRFTSGGIAVRAAAVAFDGDINGTIATFGPTDRATDSSVFMQTGLNANFVYFDSYLGGVFQRLGYILSYRGNGLYLNGVPVLHLRANNADAVEVSTTALYPTADNAITYGQAGQRIKELYCANTTINSSGEDFKTSIGPIPDEVLDAWEDVDWASFQDRASVAEKGPDVARIHAGLIAERIIAAFKKHKLDPFRYGVVCYDKWPEKRVPDLEERTIVERVPVELTAAQIKAQRGMRRKPAIKWRNIERRVMVQKTDAAGKPLTRVTVEAGDALGVRYAQANSYEAACQRRRADRLEARLTKLERAAA